LVEYENRSHFLLREGHIKGSSDMRVYCIGAVILLALLVGLVGTAQADLVGVQLSYPILVTFNIQVDYIAGAGPTGMLTAVGHFDPYGAWTALQDYAVDDSGSENYLGYFYLEAEIDKFTKKSVAGKLSVSSDPFWMGILDADTDWSGGDLDSWEVGERAYSNDLLAFGYAEDGLFDFVFGNASGDLSNGGGVSVIVAAQSVDITGMPTFLADFSNHNFDPYTLGNGKADIPEPATLSLLALGGLAMVRRHRTAGSK